MNQQNSSSAYSEEHSHERLQMIDTLKAPIIQMGRSLGYEVVENHDLGAGPVHVAWIFKPGSGSMPDMRLGFTMRNLTRISKTCAKSLPIYSLYDRAFLNRMNFLVPPE